MASTTQRDVRTSSAAAHYRAVADRLLKSVYAFSSILEGVEHDAFNELQKSEDLPKDADYVDWLCGIFTIEDHKLTKLKSVAITIAERLITELRCQLEELRTANSNLECFAGIKPPKIPPANRDTQGIEVPPRIMPDVFIDDMRATPPSSHHEALVHLAVGLVGGLEDAFERWKAAPGELERQRIVDIAQAWVDAFDRIASKRQWRLSLAYEARLAKPLEAVFLGSGRYKVGEQFVTVPDGCQADTLQGLVELNTASTDDLRRHADVSNPCAELKKLRTNYPLLAPYIFLPGGRNKGGYRTTIRDGRKSTMDVVS